MDSRREQQLIGMYMDLTGAGEAQARAVVMRILEGRGAEAREDRNAPAAESPGPASRTFSAIVLACGWLITSGGVAASAPAPALTNTFFNQPLSLREAVEQALRANPAILTARKEIEAAEGASLQSRSIVIPKAGITGGYSAVEPGDFDTFSAPGGITFGNDQSWNTQLKLVQSLYEGGRMGSGWRSAGLMRQQARLAYQTAVASALLEVRLAYYDALLGHQQIMVQEASVELLERELGETQRRFEAGTVPRFNVLRAEVELANARPRLFRARNTFRIAKNNLANLLGVAVPRETVEDIPLELSDRLEATPYSLRLAEALELAAQNRSELGQLRLAQALRKEDVVTAKSGYKPSLQGFVGYDAHNSMLSRDLTDELHGWIAGAQLNWSPFDGLRTRGRVREAQANYEKAGIALEDAGRRIELEVRTAYSDFTEARELLASQEKVVEQAEEALRLARTRYDAGTGTQLDVLSAQTALTEARTTRIQALRDYSAARARLERAVGA